MTKKVLAVLLITCVFISGLSINALAENNLSRFDGVLKEIEKKLWAGEQMEGKHMSGIASGGDPIYTTYPDITEAMMKPLIDDYMQKLKNEISELGQLSETEIIKVIEILKNNDYRAYFIWSDNNVIINVNPEANFYPIVEAREKAVIQNSADTFFKDAASIPSAWARPGVQKAIEAGIVPETMLSNYQQPITREEFAALFVKTIFDSQKKVASSDPEYAYNREEFDTQIKAVDYNFKDVVNPDVKTAYIMGLVNGLSDTEFAPNKKITRQEAAVMLVNYFQLTLADSSGISKKIVDLKKAAPWAKNALVLSYFNELVTGTSIKKDKEGELIAIEMNPLGYFTREQAIVSASRIYHESDYFELPLMVRGTVYFDPSIEYEVSKNSITAISLNERYFKREKGIIAKNLMSYAPFRAEKSINKAEQVEAMTLGVHDLALMLFDEIGGDIINDIMEWTGHGYMFTFSPPYASEREVVDALFSGKNHLLELGWSTVEINGEGFIYKYNLRNNCIHNRHSYWDKEAHPAKFKVIR